MLKCSPMILDKAGYVISQLFTKTFSLNLKPGLTDWQKLSKLKTTV
jgi:hypothetical protein